MGGDDTIAAVATAAGRGAIGIVRLSGPAVPAIAAELIGEPLPPRRARLVDFRDAARASLDRGIALYFPKPGSYTGEDMLELQGHGGPVVLSLVLGRCLELGARLAEPGEFTRRAFLNGKLDLAQAEAVADLIDAATTRAARSALRSLAGEFSDRVAALQQGLTDLRIVFEASFDFPEEELDVLQESAALERMRTLEASFAEAVRCACQGTLLRDGVRVVLSGPPNVGKSSIINQLTGEEIAIVTPIPGTTRDLLRATVAIAGIPMHLIDTAGLRATEDPVESIGVARAHAAAREADIVLLIDECGPAAAPAPVSPEAPCGKTIYVHNKVDLIGKPPQYEVVGSATHVWISAKLGYGMDYLRRALVQAAGGEDMSEGAFMARQRHVDALREAHAHVLQAIRCTRTPEFAAEELRLAQQALSRITGEYGADELLGEIFARFCIGK